MCETALEPVCFTVVHLYEVPVDEGGGKGHLLTQGLLLLKALD